MKKLGIKQNRIILYNTERLIIQYSREFSIIIMFLIYIWLNWVYFIFYCLMFLLFYLINLESPEKYYLENLYYVYFIILFAVTWWGFSVQYSIFPLLPLGTINVSIDLIINTMIFVVLFCISEQEGAKAIKNDNIKKIFGVINIYLLFSFLSYILQRFWGYNYGNSDLYSGTTTLFNFFICFVIFLIIFENRMKYIKKIDQNILSYDSEKNVRIILFYHKTNGRYPSEEEMINLGIPRSKLVQYIAYLNEEFQEAKSQEVPEKYIKKIFKYVARNSKKVIDLVDIIYDLKIPVPIAKKFLILINKDFEDALQSLEQKEHEKLDKIDRKIIKAKKEDNSLDVTNFYLTEKFKFKEILLAFTRYQLSIDTHLKLIWPKIEPLPLFHSEKVKEEMVRRIDARLIKLNNELAEIKEVQIHYKREKKNRLKLLTEEIKKISQIYTEISFSKISEKLESSIEEIQPIIEDLIFKKEIYGKIMRDKIIFLEEKQLEPELIYIIFENIQQINLMYKKIFCTKQLFFNLTPEVMTDLVKPCEIGNFPIKLGSLTLLFEINREPLRKKLQNYDPEWKSIKLLEEWLKKEKKYYPKLMIETWKNLIGFRNKMKPYHPTSTEVLVFQKYFNITSSMDSVRKWRKIQLKFKESLIQFKKILGNLI